jgi:hypothetical protein
MAQLFLMIVSVASAATAYAQAPAAPPPPADAPPPPPAYPPPAPMAAPPPPAAYPPPPAPAVESGPSDLDPSVRRWAIGYAGISQVPVASPMVPVATVPALGLRYWSSPTMGVDVALGFGWAGGSSNIYGTSMDKDGVFAFVLQAGLPFALSTHRHVSFQVIPMAAIAYGKQTISDPTGSGNDMDFSGMRVDVGVRAGFELFFGFIGIPELALSATVGAQFEMVKLSRDTATSNDSDTTLSITTTVENNPWDIFAGNVAARYYF